MITFRAVDAGIMGTKGCKALCDWIFTTTFKGFVK